MEIHDVPFSDYRYFKGASAVAGWTVKPDDEDYYHYFYCKPVGPGARSGQATIFQYVPRLSGRRKKRIACKRIAYKLVYGYDYVPVKEKVAKANQPGSGYCMKEKKTVIIVEPEIVEAKNGRMMIRGKCPDCGTVIQKYGKLIDCPECGNYREARSDDYICLWCRKDA
jgi:hypothetical protein